MVKKGTFVKNNYYMKNKEVYIYGIRSLIEAIKAGKEIDKVLVKKGLGGELFMELYREMVKHQVPYQFVPMEKLNKITYQNHQGVIGYLSLVEYQKLEQVIPFVFDQGKNPLILVLDHLTDVRNFGSIARTAECAGVDAIVIPEKGAAQVNSDAIKTSAGALHSIPVCRVPNIKNAVQYLAESGLKLISANEKAKKEYHTVDYTEPVAIIMGAEDKGISSDLLKLSNDVVFIPVLGKIESLNVSNATAVILYEAVRQRKG